MAVTLKVSFDDVAPQAALARAQAGASDMTGLMDIIGTVLVNGAVERISTSNVAPDGSPWPKSLRATIDGGKTLHDTGHLMRSITSEAEQNRVAVGSNLIYAGVHQTGATITPKTAGALFFTLANGQQVIAGAVKIPARPYLGISTEEQTEIEELSVLWFSDLLEGLAQ